MDAPLQGDAGGHTGTAPTKLRYTFTHNPPNEINHPCAILPNETRKQSTHTSGAEMHRALPPPFFKTNCVYANRHREDALLF